MQRCEQWRVQLEAGEGVHSVADAVRGSVLDFAWNRQGCRVVQLLLTLLTTRDAAALVEELHGHVVDAVQSPHANFVIQRVIEFMPPTVSAFVAEELIGRGGWAARHCYGCRIICRLVEHGATSERRMLLLDEVLAGSHELCFHMFGHYVIQVVLEHGAPQHRRAILSALRRETLRKATHRNGSHVVEKALVHAAREDRAALQHELLRNVAPLAESPFGCHVVRALLRDRDVDTPAVVAQLQQHARRLGSIRHGRALLSDAGLDWVAE